MGVACREVTWSGRNLLKSDRPGDTAIGDLSSSASLAVDTPCGTEINASLYVGYPFPLDLC